MYPYNKNDEKVIKAVRAWRTWFAERLERLNTNQGAPGEGYSGYEMDLFEATYDFEDLSK